MPNKFNVPIEATDETAKGVRSAYKNFASLTQPVERLDKATSKFSKGSAFGELIGKFSSFRKIAGDMTDGVADAAEGVGILGGAAGAAVAGVGILGVALAIAADKAVRFAAPIAAAGFEISRTSKLIGEGARDLQLWRGAAELNGVTNEAMTDALNNLGNTLNDARWGRNNQALMLLHRLGIAIPYTKDGAIDITKAMLLLSDAIHKNDPQTRQLIANIFGVAGALPLISKGAQDVQNDINTFSKTGSVMTEKQLKDSEAYVRQLTLLDDRWKHLKNEIAQNLVIPWTAPLLDFLTQAVDLFDKLIDDKNKLFGFSWNFGNTANAMFPGFGDLLSGGGSLITGLDGHGNNPRWGGPHGAAVAPSGAHNKAQAFLEAKGFSTAQARGMVAGLTAESGLDPGNVNPTSGAFGIGQWLGPRKAELMRRFGPHPTFDQELAFMGSELDTNKAGSAAIIRRQSTPSAALQAFIEKYEVPGPGELAGDMRRGGADLSAHPGTASTTAADPFAGTAGSPTGGVVKVDISLRGAPAGTIAQTKTSGNVAARTGIEHSMASIV